MVHPRVSHDAFNQIQCPKDAQPGNVHALHQSKATAGATGLHVWGVELGWDRILTLDQAAQETENLSMNWTKRPHPDHLSIERLWSRLKQLLKCFIPRGFGDRLENLSLASLGTRQRDRSSPQDLSTVEEA
ncbi:hypothetical protein ACJZ2D_006882 [Fusarium nematophilum]